MELKPGPASLPQSGVSLPSPFLALLSQDALELQSVTKGHPKCYKGTLGLR